MSPGPHHRPRPLRCGLHRPPPDGQQGPRPLHPLPGRTRPGRSAGLLGDGHHLSSIDTNNPQRDDDLRSANFFEIDAYPTMTFRSTGIRHGEDGFDVDGELTCTG